MEVFLDEEESKKAAHEAALMKCTPSYNIFIFVDGEYFSIIDVDVDKKDDMCIKKGFIKAKLIYKGKAEPDMIDPKDMEYERDDGIYYA